jgi:hypothetical protein
MKHLKYQKYFESNKPNNQPINFSDIFDILIDLQEQDGYDIKILDARKINYKLSDINNSNLINTFKFNRWTNDTKQSFKIIVDFKLEKNYTELVNYLSMMNTEISRFNDLGVYLINLEINKNLDNDKYKIHSVEFLMEKNLSNS